MSHKVCISWPFDCAEPNASLVHEKVDLFGKQMGIQQKELEESASKRN